jgi:hypothetical protein
MTSTSAASRADAQKPVDPLPSWNEGANKSAILNFVQKTTDPASPDFVRIEDRIVAFDQDGTTWVEQPLTQVMFALERLAELAPQHPEWKSTEPFASALSGDRAAFAKFTINELEAVVAATHAGMTTAAFRGIVADWLAKAKHPRWNRAYTDLVYQPMLEVMQYMRANGYTVYIVTGGGQAFVRVYADRVYGAEPEHVIGSSIAAQFEYDSSGKAVLMRPPKLLLFDDSSGKPQDIYLFLGRPPRAAFGNTTGDKQMLEYTQAGDGARLEALVLHDDDKREFAYGPQSPRADTKFGAFTQALLDEAKARGWLVISMKNDWKRLFAFEP